MQTEEKYESYHWNETIARFVCNLNIDFNDSFKFFWWNVEERKKSNKIWPKQFHNFFVHSFNWHFFQKNDSFPFWCFPILIFIFLSLFPDHDIKKLTTSVNAVVLSVPLPFIGVDGTSACNNLYTEDGTTKTQCPLKAGQKYVYKNSFDVLQVYPTIPALDVHWALTESNNREFVCFEIPAKITN